MHELEFDVAYNQDTQGEYELNFELRDYLHCMIRPTIKQVLVSTFMILSVVACDAGYSSQTTSVVEYGEVEQAESTSPTITAIATPTITDVVIPTNVFMSANSFNDLGHVDSALIRDQVLALEIAITAYQKSVGLMYRTNMSDTEGMLFVYDSEQTRNFWMKNVKIPLDIIFLDSMGIVVDVQTMSVENDLPDDMLTIYSSTTLAQYVLEINAGLAESFNIIPGMKIYFR